MYVRFEVEDRVVVVVFQVAAAAVANSGDLAASHTVSD